MLKILKTLLIVVILTILTQIGGVLYLIYKPLGKVIKKRTKLPLLSWGLRFLSFITLLIVFSIFIIPSIAKKFGRVPLPVKATKHIPLKPANVMTLLTNRHYVRPALKESIIAVSKSISETYPGTQLVYLDANFPFWNGFPLLPHRSHDDGKKLDICFLYKNKKTGKRVNRAPTILGYGFVEKPAGGEWDQPSACEEKGYWQYSLLSKLTLPKKNWQFDTATNKRLLQILSQDTRIKKIFIEPHLKQRLGLGGVNKIRFHGCQAVRHDDHIHVQL
jgi:hypothetical protein